MANSENDDRVSSYLQYLPAIFQQDAENNHDETDTAVCFIGRFLLAFENILTGLAGSDEKGLEEKIDDIHTYFTPDTSRSDFLPWLAGWVALRLRDDWNEKDKREIMGEIVPMYRMRGTRAGLQWALKKFTEANLKWDPGLEPEVDELNTPFQIKDHSTVGEDTWLDGGPPNFFRVKMKLMTRNPDKIRQYYELLTSILDMETPAHTNYELDFKTPTFQIGAYSNIGLDTMLGTIKK